MHIKYTPNLWLYLLSSWKRLSTLNFVIVCCTVLDRFHSSLIGKEQQWEKTLFWPTRTLASCPLTSFCTVPSPTRVTVRKKGKKNWNHQRCASPKKWWLTKFQRGPIMIFLHGWLLSRLLAVDELSITLIACSFVGMKKVANSSGSFWQCYAY